MLYAPDGKEITITERTIPGAVGPLAPFKPSRQMVRAYLRQAAIAHINRHYGLEDRRIRRSLALSLAKNQRFKDEVRNATQAW